MSAKVTGAQDHKVLHRKQKNKKKKQQKKKRRRNKSHGKWSRSCRLYEQMMVWTLVLACVRVMHIGMCIHVYRSVCKDA